MVAVAHAVSLEEVEAEACPYPARLLRPDDQGLCLFAAGFLGQNDAIHMWRAGMRVTCVDRDQDRLEEMRGLYPDDWYFLPGDAWASAADWRAQDARWDVVSVDNFTGKIEPRVLDSLPLWCSLARRLVTVTLGNGSGYVVPDGWRGRTMRRSPIASWLVLTRA